MSIKVSVVMPVYNAEKYLSRSIEFILNQILTELELILVNDGSKDRSLEVCREYEKDLRAIIVDKKMKEPVLLEIQVFSWQKVNIFN